MSKPSTLVLIAPSERRQALQERIGKEVPRYARSQERQRPYQTHNALAIIERCVGEGLLAKDVLDSDEKVFGAVAARAEQRDAQETGVTVSMNLSPLAHQGYMQWMEMSKTSLLPKSEIATRVRSQ